MDDAIDWIMAWILVLLPELPISVASAFHLRSEEMQQDAVDCATQALEIEYPERYCCLHQEGIDKVRTLPFELMCVNRQEVDSLNPPTEI